jgi:DNA transformation protein
MTHPDSNHSGNTPTGSTPTGDTRASNKPDPDDPVSSIPNLGPASDASFARAGITNAQPLRDLGPDAAYSALLQSGTRPHFIGYYALVMGLQGRPWNDCRGDEKVALRKRFDALKSAPSSAETEDHRMDRLLAEIGVLKPAGSPEP